MLLRAVFLWYSWFSLVGADFTPRNSWTPNPSKSHILLLPPTLFEEQTQQNQSRMAFNLRARMRPQLASGKASGFLEDAECVVQHWVVPPSTSSQLTSKHNRCSSEEPKWEVFKQLNFDLIRLSICSKVEHVEFTLLYYFINLNSLLWK